MWNKTLHDSKSHHIVQLPQVKNLYLCPVRNLKADLKATNTSPFSQTLDSRVRDDLKFILTSFGINYRTHGFNSFRRSGATLAFKNNIHLQNIMAHGL